MQRLELVVSPYWFVFHDPNLQPNPDNCNIYLAGSKATSKAIDKIQSQNRRLRRALPENGFFFGGKLRGGTATVTVKVQILRYIVTQADTPQPNSQAIRKDRDTRKHSIAEQSTLAPPHSTDPNPFTHRWPRVNP